MTTHIVHANVQRSRFARHTLAALAGLVPPALLHVFKAAQPAPAPSASEAAGIDARKVREMADSYAKTDPGFAADLHAAAARHESLYAE